MFHPRDLRRLHEAVQPRSARIESEGELPASFELQFEGEGAEIPLPQFESEGHVRETPSSFESSGELGLRKKGPEELHELRLVEHAADEEGDDTDVEYVLEGRHRTQASGTAAVFSSPESVGELFGSALASFSERLGAVVETEVKKHRFDRKGHSPADSADAEYAVRLAGLGGAFEAGEKRLRVEEAELTASRGDELAFGWDFDIQNHGGVSAKYFVEGFGAHEILAARRVSGFEEHLEWDLRNTDTGVSLGVEYETENASGYVDELRRRGFETPARTSFDFGLNTRGTTTFGSFDYETDGDPTAGFGERLTAWVGFLPLPLFSFFRLL